MHLTEPLFKIHWHPNKAPPPVTLKQTPSLESQTAAVFKSQTTLSLRLPAKQLYICMHELTAGDSLHNSCTSLLKITTT